jgi:hypothetical protein
MPAHATPAQHDAWRCADRASTKLVLLWTRLQPIRTISEIELEFVIFTAEPFAFQSIGGEARRMRRLGMSLRAIGAALGVDEKTVRKALSS